jgi:hypothetical protein
VGDWLYPLSSKSGYWFQFSDGKRSRDTGPTSFEEMILRAASDDEWGVSRGWRRMQLGDRVWVYYGKADGDLGIVGLGFVRSIEPPGRPRGRAKVKLRWNLGVTRKLILGPRAL